MAVAVAVGRVVATQITAVNPTKAHAAVTTHGVDTRHPTPKMRGAETVVRAPMARFTPAAVVVVDKALMATRVSKSSEASKQYETTDNFLSGRAKYNQGGTPNAIGFGLACMCKPKFRCGLRQR